MFLTRSLVLGFSMLALLSSVLPPLLPALSDLVVQQDEASGEQNNDHETRKDCEQTINHGWEPFQLKAVIRQPAVLHRLQGLLRGGFLLERDEAETHRENFLGPGVFLCGNTCRENLDLISK